MDLVQRPNRRKRKVKFRNNNVNNINERDSWSGVSLEADVAWPHFAFRG
jgi:hypothetical protein